MGQSLEAFMQWKALVSLLLSCSEAVSAYTDLYLPLWHFLRWMHAVLLLVFLGRSATRVLSS